MHHIEGFALTVPHLFAFGVGILVGGIVVALIGVVLLVVGVRMRPRAQGVPVWRHCSMSASRN